MNKEKVYTIDEIREMLQGSMRYFEEKFSVDKFLLFGSYAKNQQTPESDIDLLVSFTQPVDMFDFIVQDYCPRKFRDKERGVNELRSNSRSRRRNF